MALENPDGTFFWWLPSGNMACMNPDWSIAWEVGPYDETPKDHYTKKKEKPESVQHGEG